MKKILTLIIICSNITYAKEISISFDDAPMRSMAFYSGGQRTIQLIKTLKEKNVDEVIFYVNPGKIKKPEDLKRLQLYHKAGHLIGNHTFNHLSASKSSTKDFIDSVIKTDQFLKKNKLLSPYFRYPYLKRGETIQKIRKLKKSISKLGYIDGYVTIDNYDWYMNHLFQKSLKKGIKLNLNNLKRFYVESLMKSVTFYDELAQKVLKRSPRHVLLLHENDISTLFIGDLIDELRTKGWKIIAPGVSYEDPDLSMYPDVFKHGQGRVVSKALELGYPGRISSGYENEKVLDSLYSKYEIE